MLLYGYTKICTEPGYKGKETDTFITLSEKERNDEMYKEYVREFDNLRSSGIIEKEDANGNPKQSKREFMKELSDSKNPNTEVFGLIQCSDFHIQFEPFTKNL